MSYNRQQLVINDFKGVDLSSSPLQIHSSRASFSSNLINDNGVNHKRPGWRELYNFNKDPIDGMYNYTNGDHNVLIAYAGGLFRRKNLKTGKLDYLNPLTATGGLQLFEKQRVQFFRRKERLYIIGCGDYLVYGTWDDGLTYELKSVSDAQDTYVPTTTVDIEPEVVRESGSIISGDPGIAMDKPNLLTNKRKNTFIGTKGYPDIQINYYTDAEFDKSGFISLSVERSDNSGKLITDKYTLNKNGFIEIEGAKDNETTSAIGLLADLSGRCTGFYAICDLSAGNYGNVTIEFIPANATTNTSIPKCTLGTTFGAYGRSDRLFLSGNPEMKNVDFYSAFEDFTYFTAGARTEMGGDDAAITGYLRLSDSTLATFKETYANEPTVYYRKATEVDDNGAETVAFTRWEGSVGEACINPYCVANLAGDELMLSKNGLFGIVMPENISNNDRYFRERDRYVNAELRKHELKNAVAIVYENRYYLAVDGVCFVADPRFKTYLSDDIDGSFNYEWWYWENIPARVFAIIGGELYFGTADGKICVFDDKFTDRTYDETVEGELTADGASFTYRGEIDCDICNGDEITLSGLEEKLYITEHDSKNCTFKVSLTKGGEPIGNIVDELYKGEAPSSLTMKVWRYKNVVSSWYTPVFDLGAIDVAKTLLSMSLTVDPNIRGKVSFGYETKNVLRLLDFRSERVFDFDNIDFDDFSFDTGFTSSYTVKVKARRFNYIMFKFISDTDSDCAVCNFKATYIYNGRHRGIN